MKKWHIFTYVNIHLYILALAFPLLLSSFLSIIPAVGSPSKKDPDARDTTGRSSIVKRGISNDAGETGSFDQIPSCCLLACSWQDLVGTMSQLDSDQLNIATSVSINLIPHITTLYSWTELFSSSPLFLACVTLHLLSEGRVSYKLQVWRDGLISLISILLYSYIDDRRFRGGFVT